MDDLFLLFFLVSFVCFIISLFRPKTFFSLFRNKLGKKGIRLTFALLAFFFFVMVGVTTDAKPNNEQEDQDQEKGSLESVAENTKDDISKSTDNLESETIQKSITEPEIETTETDAYNMLEQEEPEHKEKEETVMKKDTEEQETASISREKIVALFPEFEFKKGEPIDGEDNFVAQNDLVIMQLIGPSESPKEMSISMTMGPTDVDKMDLHSEYEKRLRNLVTPNLSDYDAAMLSDDGDKTESDGYEVTWNYFELGAGIYVTSYTYKLLN